MEYLEFAFFIESVEEYQRDLLINALGEAGFDTFEETTDGFNAYIPSSLFNEQSFQQALDSYKEIYSFSYEKNVVQQKNWNEEWESNFDPLIVKDICYVRATFHQPRPEYPLEIIIDPKMSFGTGHHQTTTLMMEFILEEDMAGKRVLDMGAGTGILGILSHKRGAREVVGIDYDPVCYESMIENSKLNNTPFSSILCGSKDVIPNRRFDVIFANINRNILLDQMSSYASVLGVGAELYMSGFYFDDLPMIDAEAQVLGFAQQQYKLLDNWCSVKFLKLT